MNDKLFDTSHYSQKGKNMTGTHIRKCTLNSLSDQFPQRPVHYQIIYPDIIFCYSLMKIAMASIYD